jgi:hypothetical protein
MSIITTKFQKFRSVVSEKKRSQTVSVQYKLPKQLVNATSLKLQNIILWNLVASKDIICKCAYWLEILISWFLQELCSIERLSLLSVQYVGACGIWACSLRFFHCATKFHKIMLCSFREVAFTNCFGSLYCEIYKFEEA